MIFVKNSNAMIEYSYKQIWLSQFKMDSHTMKANRQQLTFDRPIHSDLSSDNNPKCVDRHPLGSKPPY